MKRKITAVLLVVALALSLGATGVFAAVSSTEDGDTCGPTLPGGRAYLGDNSAVKIDANPVFVTDPSGLNLTLHQYESDTEIRVFNEQQNVSVTSLGIDGGTYTGYVDSHIIHQEPTPDDDSDPMRGRGCISFATNIIGVITSDALLDASDSVLGLASVTYPTGLALRGLEQGSGTGYQDVIEFSGNTIKVDLQSAEVMDQIRVLTEPAPDIEKSFVDSATYTTDVDDADLGDIVGIKLEVENPYTSATVKDVIPDSLRYIPGSYGGPGTPTVVDNTLTVSVGQGDHTITFNVQVVEVQCTVQEDVENWAYLYDDTEPVAQASDEIDLNPYEGFDKVIDDWTSPTFSPCIVPMGIDVHWWVDISFTNTLGRAITGVVVQDRLGGDLELHNVDGDTVPSPPEGKKKKENSWSNPLSPPDVTVSWSGETKKVHLSWEVGDLGIGVGDTLTLKISTDVNPGTGHGTKAGQQEYTSPGWHDLNSGAVVKFTDPLTDFQLSAHTCPLKVYAAEEWLILNNKDANWQPIADGQWGLLAYYSAGDEFEYAFCGYNLEDETTYRIIYYADFMDRMNVWGGNNPGALIGTVTTDDTGYICMSGSVDLGMDLPHEDDANYDYYNYKDAGPPPQYTGDGYAHAHGAKIWLVPSDCYVVGEKRVDTWSPTRFYFETDLIWYDDTDS